MTWYAHSTHGINPTHVMNLMAGWHDTCHYQSLHDVPTLNCMITSIRIHDKLKGIYKIKLFLKSFIKIPYFVCGWGRGRGLEAYSNTEEYTLGIIELFILKPWVVNGESLDIFYSLRFSVHGFVEACWHYSGTVTEFSHGRLNNVIIYLLVVLCRFVFSSSFLYITLPTCLWLWLVNF